MKSCLICDDHVLVREALVGAVRQNWADAVITEVGDFQSAWSAAPGHDLCITDLIMPGASPRDGVAGLRRAAPDMPILVVTGAEDDAMLIDMLELGVGGFASKTSSAVVIEAALNLIVAGGRYLPPRIAEIAASRINSPLGAPPSPAVEHEPRTPAAPGAPGGALERLTDRQMDVIRLVAQGLTNKQIARALNLAPSTVKTHLANLQAFLGAANRTEASIKAQSLNLLTP
jgi:DNA-binding NarL/FixJ family response regulator